MLQGSFSDSYQRGGALPANVDLPSRHRARSYMAGLVLIIAAVAALSFVKAMSLVAWSPSLALSPPQTPRQVLAVSDSKVSEPPAAQSMPALEKELNKWITKHPGGQWSVVIRGLNGDSRQLTINGNQKYEVASIYKLLAMYPLFKKVPLANFNDVQIAHDGIVEPLSDCVDKMLSHSDNPCGVAIARDYLGWPVINHTLHRAGYESISLQGADSMVASPLDVTTFLVDFHNGKLFNRQTSDYIKGILLEQQLRSGIPAGCKGCTVANKTGDYNGNLHDTAIVSNEKTTYALSVFSKGGNYAQIAELTKIVNKHMAKR